MKMHLKKFLLIFGAGVLFFWYSVPVHSQADFWQPISGLEGVMISSISVNPQGDIIVSSDSSRLYRKIANEDFWSVFKLGESENSIGKIVFNS